MQNFLSLFRSALTLIGAYLIGHAVLGVSITAESWGIVVGAIMALTGTIWGIADKTTGIEQLQSGVRSFLISVGGIVVASGKISGDTLNQIVGLVTAIIPVIQSWVAKVKTKQVATGVIQPSTTGLMIKKSVSILLFLIIAFGANAQSMFKAIPKPVMRYGVVAPSFDSSGNIIPSSPVAQTTTGFRFTGPMVLYSLPGSAIYTGIGADYEHDTYNSTTSKWYTDWAVAIGGYEGGQFAPNNIQAVTAIGLSVQLFNKLLTVGVLYDITNKRVQGGVGPSVSLNN